MTYLSEIKEKKDDDLAPVEDDTDDENDQVLDQRPARVICPHCGMNVITFIEHEASWVTYAVCLALLMVLGWAAVCVVPVVYPLFKDVVHHCPRCLSVLAARSRVVLPSFRKDVMTFRFGNCVVVLARRYVLMLLAATVLLGGFVYVRSPTVAPIGIDALSRADPLPLTWVNFTQDCGFKSYLGNPIHVTVAFNEKYKNNTFHWEGDVHHVEEGIPFLWQRGALYVSMEPPQFPMKKDRADVVLLFNDANSAGKEALKLRHGAHIDFYATMVEVGKRGAPHVMALWEVHQLAPPPNKKTAERPRSTTDMPKDVVIGERPEGVAAAAEGRSGDS